MYIYIYIIYIYIFIYIYIIKFNLLKSQIFLFFSEVLSMYICNTYIHCPKSISNRLCTDCPLTTVTKLYLMKYQNITMWFLANVGILKNLVITT